MVHFPAVLLGRLAGHGYVKQSQPVTRDELRGLRKFLTVLSFDETLFISIACSLSSLPRDGGDVRGGLHLFGSGFASFAVDPVYCCGDAGKISDLITTGTAPDDGINAPISM